MWSILRSMKWCWLTLHKFITKHGTKNMKLLSIVTLKYKLRSLKFTFCSCGIVRSVTGNVPESNRSD
jgi:hypothetical protein